MNVKSIDIFLDDHNLSPSEKGVISKILLTGDTGEKIAKEIGLQLKTIKFHVSNAYKKLNVTSRSKLFIKFYADYLLGGNFVVKIEPEKAKPQAKSMSLPIGHMN